MLKRFAVTLFVFYSCSAFSSVNCADVKYGTSNYHEKMQELMVLAKGGGDGYFNRYDESAVSSICKNNSNTLKTLVDNGFVKSKEVDSLKRILLSNNKVYPNRSYYESRRTFESLGLCAACADNVAQYYTKQPQSQCAMLATDAIAGNQKSLAVLRNFPDFCRWKY